MQNQNPPPPQKHDEKNGTELTVNKGLLGVDVRKDEVKKDDVKKDTDVKKVDDRLQFVGMSSIQFGLWAHFMSYG